MKFPPLKSYQLIVLSIYKHNINKLDFFVYTLLMKLLYNLIIYRLLLNWHATYYILCLGDNMFRILIVEDDNELDVGDLVLWDDVAINDYPIEEREIQRHRVYQIIKIINDEIVLIADDYGEVEVLKTELRKIE